MCEHAFAQNEWILASAVHPGERRVCNTIFICLSLLCTANPFIMLSNTSPDFSPQLNPWLHSRCPVSPPVLCIFCLMSLPYWWTLCFLSINLLLQQIHVAWLVSPLVRWYVTWFQAAFKPRMPLLADFIMVAARSHNQTGRGPLGELPLQELFKSRTDRAKPQITGWADLPGWKARCHQRSQQPIWYMVTYWLRGLGQVKRTFYLFKNKRQNYKVIDKCFQRPNPRQKTQQKQKNWKKQNKTKTSFLSFRQRAVRTQVRQLTYVYMQKCTHI